MYARRVSMKLKPNCTIAFTQTLEKEIIPMLRKQNGFQDELSMVDHDGTKAVAISLWDKEDSASAYGRSAYPDVVKMLSKVVEGTPTVDNYEVANSTFHKIATKVSV